MKNLGVIFGGVTCEHDVSVVSGLQLIENVDKTKYKIVPIYIHSNGEWYTGDKLLDANIYKNFDNYEKELKKAVIMPTRKGLVIFEKGMFAKETFIELDVVIPSMHGMNGEDGTLQGLLELANIPYSSSGVLGASVGMDKIVMKKVFEAYGMPVLPYTYFIREDWEEDREKIINQIESKVPYPMFVKPSNLGSSIGISKAKNKDELVNAIEIAINYDQRIVVEKGVEHLREINCSALGYANKVDVSVCEEPINWESFLSFEDKYLGGGKGAKAVKFSKTGPSMENMGRRIPAEITDEQREKIEGLTRESFRALNSKGVVRVDFIIDKDTNGIYINEINTIPGSFSFYLWTHNDVTYTELINRLVEIAEKANEDKNKNNYTYKSDIISNIAHGLKK